jgi:hypothetical protein
MSVQVKIHDSILPLKHGGGSLWFIPFSETRLQGCDIFHLKLTVIATVKDITILKLDNTAHRLTIPRFTEVIKHL